MISVALIAGLAGFWLWAVLNDEEGIAGPVTRLLEKNRVTEKWMRCPFCSGAWFAGIASVSVFHPSVVVTIVTALAAAAVTGLLGSYVGE